MIHGYRRVSKLLDLENRNIDFRPVVSRWNVMLVLLTTQGKGQADMCG